MFSKFKNYYSYLNEWQLYSDQLTWRDIQHLTVETSSMTGLINIDVMENGVKRKGI